MPNEILTFDALASGVGGTDPGTPLMIGPGTSYRLLAFDVAAPSFSGQYAGSVDTEGSVLASGKDENRQFTMTILCDTAAGLRALQAKAMKIRRERGTLKWTLPSSGEVIYYDLYASDAFAPQIDPVYQKNAGALCTVQLSFTAAPYGRGPSVTLSAHTETTLPALVFTETGVKGDVAALGDLVLGTAVGTTQQLWLWGVQSRYYSSATTAALYYEAEALLPSGASSATAVGPAGASGGGSNVIRNTSLGTTWTDVVRLTMSAGTAALTHVGTFRMVARVQAPNTNTGTVSMRLRWGRGITNVTWSANAPVDLDPTYEASWRLVDLGQISLPSIPRDLWSGGTTPPSWSGMIEAESTVAGDDINVDFVMFLPADEGDGQATDTASQFVDGSLRARHDGVFTNQGDNIPIQNFEGKYLTIPPAGAEARTLRIIVKPSRGALLTGADSAIDDMSATLTYTPRYLVVPAP